MRASRKELERTIEERDLDDLIDYTLKELDKMYKQYLGDSVYADFDGYGITLTTENGLGASNTIYLEPQVLAALEMYKSYLWKKSENQE